MPPRPRKPQTPEEALSRALSKTLRHAAKQEGIPQDSQGWCLISDLLAHRKFTSLNASLERIFDVVSKDSKGRYELSADKTKIRAVQGHSVNVDVGLTPLLTPEDLPTIIVHGTYFNVLDSIKQNGLNKMTRLHIHLAQQLPEKNHPNKNVVSGMRNGSEVLVYIDGPKALANGVKFYRSTNNAILSPGINGVIPPEYFSKITNRNGDVL